MRCGGLGGGRARLTELQRTTGMGRVKQVPARSMEEYTAYSNRFFLEIIDSIIIGLWGVVPQVIPA